LATRLRAPRTWEDCVLDHVKPGMSDDAVTEVALACGYKYRASANVQDSFRAIREATREGTH
jgi:hypothetical protein